MGWRMVTVAERPLVRSGHEAVWKGMSLTRPTGCGGRLTHQRPGIGHRSEVVQLVGIDDRADDLDPAVEHVQGQHVDHPAGRVTEHGPRLPVDLVRVHLQPGVGEPAAEPREHASDVVQTTTTRIHCGALPPPSP